MAKWTSYPNPETYPEIQEPFTPVKTPVAAVTGHRPDKLATPLLRAYSDQQFDRLVQLFRASIRKYGIRHGMSGMALGADQAYAQALIQEHIPWTAAIPFNGQERRWPKVSQERYATLLEYAADIQVVTPWLDPKYAEKKDVVRAMYDRNVYMLRWITSQSNMIPFGVREPYDAFLLALYNGDRTGGTAHCVDEAINRNIPVVNLWGSWDKYA